MPGGTYFFTVNLHDRRRDLLVSHIDVLRRATTDVRRRAPFHIDAWVVLPEHMHCVWTLPPGDDDFSNRWRELKKAFSKAIAPIERRDVVRERRNERGIWQRRFWEHTIHDDADYTAHLDYVHFNPVKHGLVTRVADWPYSSFHRAVSDGLYPVDWGVGVDGQGASGLEAAIASADGASLIRPTGLGRRVPQITNAAGCVGGQRFIPFSALNFRWCLRNLSAACTVQWLSIYR